MYTRKRNVSLIVAPIDKKLTLADGENMWAHLWGDCTGYAVTTVGTKLKAIGIIDRKKAHELGYKGDGSLGGLVNFIRNILDTESDKFSCGFIYKEFIDGRTVECSIWMQKSEVM